VIDYARQPRAAGMTKFRYWKLWNLALEGITGFSTVPLRIWTYLGVVVAGIAFAYMIYFFIRTLLHGNDVPGYPSLLLSILFLGGVQLIGIGVLGEYLGRVYDEVKQRPKYIVRSMLSRRDGRNIYPLA
jgi:glycosyltransferase involved in cell wall biosynthesis